MKRSTIRRPLAAMTNYQKFSFRPIAHKADYRRITQSQSLWVHGRECDSLPLRGNERDGCVQPRERLPTQDGEREQRTLG
jgi:hypothetical protein